MCCAGGCFYALNAPISKLLLGRVSPSMMAAFLYLGCGFGMAIVQLAGTGRESHEERLTKMDLPYTLAMIVLDIAAPIALMLGLERSSAESAALLNNFEIVATSLIALLIFKERISKHLWVGIGLVTLSSAILSTRGAGGVSLSVGSLFILLACVCWGFENNCTRALSSKSPLQIVVVKGIFSGLGALLVALISGEAFPTAADVVGTMFLGFVAYGLSILFYIYSQRELGAARTSAYYAIAPFVGVLLSWVIFREAPTVSFLIALVIMIAGTIMVTKDAAESE